MTNEPIVKRGIVVNINNVSIYGIVSDGVPIPDVIYGVATIKYNASPGDKGQAEVERVYYETDNSPQQFEINIHDLYYWEFDARIISYEILNDCNIMRALVNLKLCGHFKYYIKNELIASNDFS